MNSLLYYYNNVQKMAAYRQAKRMQRGVKLGINQVTSGSDTIRFVSNPILIGTEDFSVEFYGTMYGAGTYYSSLFSRLSPFEGGSATFYIYCKSFPNNGIYGVLFSPDTSGNILGDQVVVDYVPGDDSKFLVTVTRQGTMVKVYINGELKATKEQSAVKDLGDLQLAIANSSEVGFVRVWNMCLSADEIATLYNNGDPMGYVVPKAKRDGLLAEYLPQNLMGQKERPLQVISENSYTWDNVTTGAPSLDIRTNPGIKTGVTYKVNLTVSGFSEGEPYLYAGSRVSIPAANGTYDLLVTPSGDYSYISVYGGTNIQLKNLTITVNKVEVANVATSWLDSAKQLPLSDEYMEPLFESIGGYDMAANGAPEILYNE